MLVRGVGSILQMQFAQPYGGVSKIMNKIMAIDADKLRSQFLHLLHTRRTPQGHFFPAFCYRLQITIGKYKNTF